MNFKVSVPVFRLGSSLVLLLYGPSYRHKLKVLKVISNSAGIFSVVPLDAPAQLLWVMNLPFVSWTWEYFTFLCQLINTYRVPTVTELRPRLSGSINQASMAVITLVAGACIKEGVWSTALNFSFLLFFLSTLWSILPRSTAYLYWKSLGLR